MKDENKKKHFFSTNEKNLLTKLISKYTHFSKSGNGKQKQHDWNVITNEFNHDDVVTTYRTTAQLKKCYQNMRFRNRSSEDDVIYVRKRMKIPTKSDDGEPSFCMEELGEFMYVQGQEASGSMQTATSPHRKVTMNFANMEEAYWNDKRKAAAAELTYWKEKGEREQEIHVLERRKLELEISKLEGVLYQTIQE